MLPSFIPSHKGSAASLGLMLLILALLFGGCSSEPLLEFEEGDRIAVVGNALPDRMQHDGYLETYLQAAHPGHGLVFRNLAFTGDEVHDRPRAHEEGFGDPDSHLERVEASIVFGFFGYNESFDDDPEAFAGHLTEWVDHTRSQRYDGEEPPRIVLFSPIAHEDLETHNLPDGRENNRRLEAYTRAMAEVAEEKDVAFVDLFRPTRELYETSEEPLTINGVHLGSAGNHEVARVIAEALLGSQPRIDEEDFEALREAVLEKNWHWHNRYRATGGNDVWGSRAELHGNGETLQHELEMLDVMTANRDELVWARAGGEDLEVDDSNVPPPLEVESNWEESGHVSPTGEVTFLGGEEAIDELHVMDGLEVNLFASEAMFPELANPVQMQVDTQGRVWAAAWATYPKWEPLKEMNDRLVYLEDTTGDGVADELTTFAYVHNPTGFEFWNGGVIVVSAPNILFLKDTTGDGKADERITLMSGIDSADTHHTANNVIYGPDGYIYYQRGVFHLHNVETPWDKSHRSEMEGLYRFNPRTYEFDFHVQNGPNSHGISFDRWGHQFITDATSGSAFQVFLEDDGFDKRPLLDHTVRPVAGNHVLSSQHLPEELENNFLIFNTIGFLGAKRYGLTYDSDAVWGEEREDLFYSDDHNFRPTDGVVGSDGALYISDWQNPTVGHMQHNLRDPIRDHEHGRIYRITAEDRPLQEPVAIHGEPVEDLVDLLEHPVDGVRHRVRIELSGRGTDEVIAAAQAWAQQFDAESEDGAHAMLEALWLHQQHNVVNRELLEQLLSSPVEQARIAARRVAWFWDERGEDGAPEVAAEHDSSVAEAASDGRAGSELDLTDRDAAELTVRAVVEEMRFDVAEFTVRAGQEVELTLENPDNMPHNLVIVAPGAADDVAGEASEMGGEGFEKQFIPENESVLYATSMLDAGEAETLSFTAPSEPGEYQFVCTFPGHGTLMRGVMRVEG